MRAALFSPADPDGESFGHLVEACVLAQYPGYIKDDAYYARWSRGELDFVFFAADGRPTEVVEVKWSNRFADDPEKQRELSAFLAEHTGLRAVTVTSRTEAGRHDVAGVAVDVEPASVFCLRLGISAVSTEVALHEERPARPLTGRALGEMLDEVMGPA